MLYSLGRRFERMLFSGGLLSVLCIGLFLISFSADITKRQQLRDSLAYAQSCLNGKAAEEIDENFRKKYKLPEFLYVYPLLKCLHERGYDGSNNYFEIKDEVEKKITSLAGKSSKEINNEITNWINDLSSKPSNFHGLEIPNHLAFDIAGNKIESQTYVILIALKILLGPLLFFWSTGLISTRVNELYESLSTNKYTAQFPHILNTFPLIPYKPYNKKNKPLSVKSHVYLHVFIRCVIMATLAVLTIGLYIASLLIEIDMSEIKIIGTLGAFLFLSPCAIGMIFQEAVPPATKILFFYNENK